LTVVVVVVVAVVGVFAVVRRRLQFEAASNL
jgi:hypothetical protein